MISTGGQKRAFSIWRKEAFLVPSDYGSLSCLGAGLALEWHFMKIASSDWPNTLPFPGEAFFWIKSGTKIKHFCADGVRSILLGPLSHWDSPHCNQIPANKPQVYTTWSGKMWFVEILWQICHQKAPSQVEPSICSTGLHLVASKGK